LRQDAEATQQLHEHQVTWREIPGNHMAAKLNLDRLSAASIFRRAPTSVTATAARGFDEKQFVEVEFDNGLQPFRPALTLRDRRHPPYIL
jgi:hypothetical protein